MSHLKTLAELHAALLELHPCEEKPLPAITAKELLRVVPEQTQEEVPCILEDHLRLRKLWPQLTDNSKTYVWQYLFKARAEAAAQEAKEKEEKKKKEKKKKDIRPPEKEEEFDMSTIPPMLRPMFSNVPRDTLMKVQRQAKRMEALRAQGKEPKSLEEATESVFQELDMKDMLSMAQGIGQVVSKGGLNPMLQAIQQQQQYR